MRVSRREEVERGTGKEREGRGEWGGWDCGGMDWSFVVLVVVVVVVVVEGEGVGVVDEGVSGGNVLLFVREWAW